MKKTNICIIGGDGIGPDIMTQAKKVLMKLGPDFEYSKAYAGYDEYKRNGSPLSDKTIKLVRDADAILFGAVTTPPHIEGYFSPIVKLRKKLDLYANIRPIKSIPLSPMRQDIDIVIFRENTEDLYAGIERQIPDGAVTERIITRANSERIIEKAFHFATENKRKKVTLIHKSNVMRLTDGLFLKIGCEIAKKYKEIEFEDMLVDSCAMRLVLAPEKFDVLVTTNMFGDILSDEAAGLVGGLGVVASANIGDKTALFEPVHGSAPKYQGKDIANPSAMFFATAMMLDYLGYVTLAHQLNKAVLKSIKSGNTTRDLGGNLKTSEFTDVVLSNL
ncbi:MAG: isocitrate/isopropylmalate dehydrogenase family protein [Candidatus Roizmanbacteria bacterium]|nr:isocitrate/isopropylmalate dehydrogenase family protein [Candidatus Roizmanbacteria bacterium]